MESSYLLFGVFIGWVLSIGYRAIRLGSFHQTALSIIQQAENQAREKELLTEAKLQELTLAHEMKLRDEKTYIEKEKQLLKQEKKDFKQNLSDFDRTKKTFSEKEAKLIDSLHQAEKRLESIAKLSFEDAKKEVWNKAELEVKKAHEYRVQEWQKLYYEECQAQASSLLFSALERKAQAITKEMFLQEISIPDNTISKLIGKEGRNIQTLESLLQVYLLIDEPTHTLRISSHDPKKRTIAKTTIEEIFRQDKITPTTIKTTYDATIVSFAKILEEQGRLACTKVSLEKKLPPEVLRTIGELSLRSSVGQNVLLHSIEVAELMGILASELGFLTERATAIGLLHDIGKALPVEWGTSHALAGSQFLETFGLDEEIYQAVASHHGETQMTSFEARLLPICDRLSAQLPGARKENTLFLDLVHQCEHTATTVPGVLSAWAHYAGNHIELVVRAEKDIAEPHLRTQLEELFFKNPSRLPVKISLL